MLNKILSERLTKYALSTTQSEEHAIKEILQEIALYGLASTNFFNVAAFQGGTALRILHGLPRFSEDLDFILKKPDPIFEWEPYINSIIFTCKQYGVEPTITDKSQVNNVIKKMFLKDDSVGKMLDLSFAHNPSRKLSIKLEIDTNPPEGSSYETKFLEFPIDYAVLAQDLSSNFAGKCHALLCRKYVKGRDWYDFGWYVTHNILPNFVLLSDALNQHGPWENQNIQVTTEWFIKTMQNKIESIDWKQAIDDVSPFLNTEDQKSLSLWSSTFFSNKLNKLQSLLK